MAHSGRPRGSQSPSLFRSRRDQLGSPPDRQLPYSAEDKEDWETDPDYVHDTSRPWKKCEISTASIISDLSKSIRDLSLGKSSLQSTKEGADPQNHILVYQDPGEKHGKAVEGHQPTRCPHVHSSPSLGIERSSLFNRNAAEKLDTFFSEKLKTWASDTARLSDTEAAQEEPSNSKIPWRAAKNGPPDHEQGTGRQNHRCVAHRRGNVGTKQVDSSRDNYDPGRNRCLRCPQQRTVGRGQALDGLSRRQEGSRPSTGVSSSARILPQCRISHVQCCGACQAFNQGRPVGKGSAWAPLQEEESGGTSVSPQKHRTQPPCQPQIPDRIAKVQQWLEQTPMEPHPATLQWHQKHKKPNVAGPGAWRQLPVYGCPAQREGEPWGPALEAAGDHQSQGIPAEARHLRKSRHEESPKHPPAARIPPCDDSSTSPATCSCLFCERQRPRVQLVAGREAPDLSAEEVAARLQAENRVPRIVEAFERRSLREAKIAEREKALRAALQRDSERKHRAPTSRAEPRLRVPASGPRKARAAPPPQQHEEQRRQPPHEPGARKQGEAVGKQPGFLDRLRRRS